MKRLYTTKMRYLFKQNDNKKFFRNFIYVIIPLVLQLNRDLVAVEDALDNSLQPRKIQYVFEGVSHLGTQWIRCTRNIGQVSKNFFRDGIRGSNLNRRSYVHTRTPASGTRNPDGGFPLRHGCVRLQNQIIRIFFIIKDNN